MTTNERARSARVLGVLLVGVSLAALAMACAAENGGGPDSRSQNAGAYTATQSPAANNFGTTAHDMPGGSRWSGTSKGK